MALRFPGQGLNRAHAFTRRSPRRSRRTWEVVRRTCRRIGLRCSQNPRPAISGTTDRHLLIVGKSRGPDRRVVSPIGDARAAARSPVQRGPSSSRRQLRPCVAILHARPTQARPPVATLASYERPPWASPRETLSKSRAAAFTRPRRGSGDPGRAAALQESVDNRCTYGPGARPGACPRLGRRRTGCGGGPPGKAEDRLIPSPRPAAPASAPTAVRAWWRVRRR